VDGIRIDSAALLTKDPRLPDTGPGDQAPFTDRDDVHDIYRAWRAVAGQYPGRVLIGEVWLADAGRLARYLSPDELHTVFNFPYLCCPWDAARLREVIDSTLAFHAVAGAPPTWVLSNHDVDRHVSRYGRADTSFGLDRRDHSQPVDLELGTRRARAAALLTMALPGSVYLYQGEELGLWEVEDIADERRQDPIWYRTDGADPGRDGCRVPLPWAGLEPPFGFSPPGVPPGAAGPANTAPPWLPQPKEWRELTVELQADDPDSMLELYRAALRLRRAEPALGDGRLHWLPAPAGVLAFGRGDLSCVANLSPAPVALPAHTAVLLASGPLDDDLLPPDTAAWLRTPGVSAEPPPA
jgi:alpha-glucosidase